MVKNEFFNYMHIMKKDYITPSIELITFNAESMLAASTGEIPMNPNVPGTPATQKKDNNLWEHDWE